MKKMTLALDALLVESFEVEPAESVAGTVHAHGSDVFNCDSDIPCSEYDCTPANPCNQSHPQCTFTCATACEQSCLSCDSCELSCFC